METVETQATETPAAVIAEPSEGATETTEQVAIEEIATDTPEQVEEKKRNGIQDRMHELTAEKKQLKADRDYYRDQLLERDRALAELKAKPTAPVDEKPKLSDYTDPEAYVEALTDYKVRQTLRGERESVKLAEEVQANSKAFASALEKKGAELPDFKESFDTLTAVAASKGPSGDALKQAIMEMGDKEIAAEIIYHLGKSPSEAQKLLSLPPIAMGLELGRIAARIETKPKPNTTSKAPPPTDPLTRGNTAPAKAPEAMSANEYLRWRASGGKLT